MVRRSLLFSDWEHKNERSIVDLTEKKLFYFVETRQTAQINIVLNFAVLSNIKPTKCNNLQQFQVARHRLGLHLNDLPTIYILSSDFSTTFPPLLLPSEDFHQPLIIPIILRPFLPSFNYLNTCLINSTTSDPHYHLSPISTILQLSHSLLPKPPLLSPQCSDLASNCLKQTTAFNDKRCSTRPQLTVMDKSEVIYRNAPISPAY